MSESNAAFLIFIGTLIVSMAVGIKTEAVDGFMTLGICWTVWGIFHQLLNYSGRQHC